MLDLKAKLAAAGLVSQKDVERASARPARPPRASTPAVPSSRLAVEKLRDAGKAEQYDAIRRLVTRVRLDPPERLPSEAARPFHFVMQGATEAGAVGRVQVEPETAAWIEDGRAGIVAFMSHHGLSHAVVPAVDARAISELFPSWLRRLGRVDDVP